jgi:hypothetical protein
MWFCLKKLDKEQSPIEEDQSSDEKFFLSLSPSLSLSLSLFFRRGVSS